jgi:hypothetical protein
VRNILGIALVGAAVAVFASFPSKTVSHEGTPAGHAVDKPVLETLLKTKLAGVEGTEVIVSRVSFPPNTSLPKHWHPGEEFAYVIEGSVIRVTRRSVRHQGPFCPTVTNASPSRRNSPR